MTTPYGDTAFSKGERGTTRWLETTYPGGAKDRVEYNQSSALGLPGSEQPDMVPAGMFTRNTVLYARNTFYWDREAYAHARNDYTKARLYHWLHSSDYASTIGVLESIKMPLENRVWYNYDGQAQSTEGATVPGTTSLPSKVGRVLDDGTTQLY